MYHRRRVACRSYPVQAVRFVVRTPTRETIPILSSTKRILGHTHVCTIVGERSEMSEREITSNSIRVARGSMCVTEILSSLMEKFQGNVLLKRFEEEKLFGVLFKFQAIAEKNQAFQFYHNCGLLFHL